MIVEGSVERIVDIAGLDRFSTEESAHGQVRLITRSPGARPGDPWWS